jgi:hypothetical protein
MFPESRHSHARKFIISVSIAFLVLVQIAYSGSTGKIAGKVISAETGEPLAGANVMIEGTSYGAAADEEGDYFIIHLPPGSYTVQASVIGYETLRISNVLVRIDKTSVVEFVLRTVAVEGQEVLIVAERPVVDLGIANTSTILDGDELGNLPLLQFKDVLDRQMGAEVLDSRGLTLRSGREHEISLTMDGIETRDGIDNMIYTRVNPDAVQEVQISTGGFSAQYGNARAGVISVQTKEGGEKYSFTLDVRSSKAAPKHFGQPWYERERAIYLSDSALSNPVVIPAREVWANDEIDREALEEDPENPVYGTYITLDPVELFEGWEARSQQVDPDDPVYGEFYNQPRLCRELYKWRLRDEVVKYGDKSDINGNATFGGPVPFLRNTYFFASGRLERNYYLIRAQQDYFQDWGTSLKISSQLTSKLKMVLTGSYMETSGINRTDRESGVEGIGDPNPVKNDQRNIIESPESFAWFIYHRLEQPNELWPYSEFSVSTRIRRQYGISLSQLLSNQTFWDFSLSYQTFNAYGRYDAQKRVLDTPKTFYDPEDPSVTATLTGPYAFAPQGYYRDDAGLWSYIEDITDVRIAGSYHNLENSKASSLHMRANFTSQVNKYNQVNMGGEFTYLDVLKDEYRNYDINDRHWWNWHVKTKQGAGYLQNKLEFKGMIATLGVRADFSIPHEKWYDLEDHPYQPWFSGTWVTLGEGTDNRHYDLLRADSAGVKPFFATPKIKTALSPRLAVSHPIGESGKIFFNYGHYSQLPDLEKRYYFLRRERAENARIHFIGDPNLDYERTVQYEVGYAQSLFDVFKVQITAYYRDIANLARPYQATGYFDTVHVVEPVDSVYTYDEVGYTSWSNSGAEDVRGLEFRLEKRLGRFFRGWFNASYEVYTDSRYRYSTISEEPDEEPSLFPPTNQRPSARPRWNLNLAFHSPANFGPSILGANPLANIDLSILYWWRSQPKINYNYVPGLNQYYQEFENVQWKPHQGSNLRFSKRLSLISGRIAPVFYIQVLNVFNHKNMNRGSFTDSELNDYLNSLKIHDGDQPGDHPGDGEKDYIRLPEPEPFFLFLNPRQIFVGFRIEL